MCLKWDRRLKADESIFFKNIDMQIDTMAIKEAPFIRRYERRKIDVQYIDFIHGRSARFMDFRKKVGLTTVDVCRDCEVDRDSVEHKLFRCHKFQGELREDLINSIGDQDYRSAILFSKEGEARLHFRR